MTTDEPGDARGRSRHHTQAELNPREKLDLRAEPSPQTVSHPHRCTWKKKAQSQVAFALSGICFAVLLGSLLFAAHCYERALPPTPAPAFEASWDDAGFPQVDWAYWQQLNPDVVGWITVPGTPLDYPIVQAPAQDPGYYLTHDVYRTWNFAGCPYLDAGCAEGGLESSRNAVVFAHNLGHGNTSLFATAALYQDAGFAAAHRRIFVQTPTSKQAFTVMGSACTPGWRATKRTSFAGDDDFRSWLALRLKECQTVLDDDVAGTDRVLTLCTCSYSRWEDERTLVYAR